MIFFRASFNFLKKLFRSRISSDFGESATNRSGSSSPIDRCNSHHDPGNIFIILNFFLFLHQEISKKNVSKYRYASQKIRRNFGSIFLRNFGSIFSLGLNLSSPPPRNAKENERIDATPPQGHRNSSAEFSDPQFTEY